MLITTENLSLAYTDAQETIYAVRDTSVAFPETGLHAIIGPSGSGKTSLLYLLSGIKPPTSGSVTFAGSPLPESSGKLNYLRRTEMGFVFQMHFLINYLTVLENILVGSTASTKKSRQKAEELIDTLKLNGLEKRKPFELSGGQRQRVAIARAFINSPKVVFVDEPTASLDQAAGKRVLGLLENFAQNACVIVVTHDENILNRVESAFRMRDGRLEKITS